MPKVLTKTLKNSSSNLLLAYFHSKGVSQRYLKRPPIDPDDFSAWKDWSVSTVRTAPRIGAVTVRRCMDSSPDDFLAFAAKLRDGWVRLLHSDELHFPISLECMDSAPNILYAVGECTCIPNKCFSIVWSRTASGYTDSIVRTLIPRLWENAFSIVSGGAKGADALAHAQAIRSSVSTISVFWTDIFARYPAENRPLFDSILRTGGLLVSPFAVWSQTRREHFAIRNAIVAGLSIWTLVTEAGIRSGSVITIRHALDFWRDTYAVPGDITRENSAGCNVLIRDSMAKAYTCPDDIEGILPSVTALLIEEVDPILSICGSGGKTLDEIGVQLRESVSSLSLKVARLEVAGKLRRTVFGTYARI